MLSSLLLAVAFADCPDPEPFIRNAEQDAVSYFLADAEAALANAADSFHCTQPSPTLVARFFLARAMIWQLQEDDRALDALHRAKQLDSQHFTKELGDEMKKRWGAVEIENLAPTIAVTVRGMKRSDVLLIDGTVVDTDPLATTPGLHLIQVQRKGNITYGRIVEAELGSPLELSLENPKPTNPDAYQAHFRGPITLGKGLRDANANRLSMVRDVVVVASLTPEGRSLAQRRRRNTVLQGIALTALTTGPYLTYLGAWDVTVGHNTEGSAGPMMLLNGIGLTAGGLISEIILKAHRRKLKKRLIEQANTLATP